MCCFKVIWGEDVSHSNARSDNVFSLLTFFFLLQGTKIWDSCESTLQPCRRVISHLQSRGCLRQTLHLQFTHTHKLLAAQRPVLLLCWNILVIMNSGESFIWHGRKTVMSTAAASSESLQYVVVWFITLFLLSQSVFKYFIFMCHLIYNAEN